MAKETTKKTTKVASACEQYVVEELKKTKQELENARNVIKTLQDINQLSMKNYDILLEMVKKAFCNSKVEKENYTMVYVNDSFVGLYDNENVCEKDKDLVALTELIRFVRRNEERN